jgi:hypothetical protein
MEAIMKKQPKTVMLTEAELKAKVSAGKCPCGAALTDRHPQKLDERTGRHRSAGYFLGCSQYGKTCFLDYSLSLDGREKIVATS